MEEPLRPKSSGIVLVCVCILRLTLRDVRLNQSVCNGPGMPGPARSERDILALQQFADKLILLLSVGIAVELQGFKPSHSLGDGGSKSHQ